MFPRPAFFAGARLNFAENLLYPKSAPSEDSLAVIEATETSQSEITWKELRERVRLCTLALRKLGVVEGDRVAGYLANHCNTLVAMLSAVSIGALWTGVSPDTGVHAVLDRLQQIEPKILFSDNSVIYNGKVHEVRGKVKEVVEGLPNLHALLVFETVENCTFETDNISEKTQVWCYNDMLKTVDQTQPHEFTQLPADHPIYILYSSGTTGKPKVGTLSLSAFTNKPQCIVHGAIGTLIQHKKEHQIHCDIRQGDRVFYYTTCTWYCSFKPHPFEADK
jgi:acetoacetyl-CoA synthetase